MHLPVAVHRDPRAGGADRHGVLRERLTRIQVLNRTRATVLATDCRTADNPIARGLGLLPRSSLREGEGLRLPKTSAITMLFMRFPIDAVFVDGAGRVVRTCERLGPWTLAVTARGAREVIELPAGTVARTRTQAGDEIDYEPQPAR